jgi:hypothetical protein
MKVRLSKLALAELDMILSDHSRASETEFLGLNAARIFGLDTRRKTR